MSAPTVGRKQALDDLLGNTCKGCGRAKGSGKSHCRRCYLSLPRNLRGALYQGIGHGYEAAYAESLDVLGRLNGSAVQQGLGL